MCKQEDARTKGEDPVIKNRFRHHNLFHRSLLELKHELVLNIESVPPWHRAKPNNSQGLDCLHLTGDGVWFENSSRKSKWLHKSFRTTQAKIRLSLSRATLLLKKRSICPEESSLKDIVSRWNI
jgi:hypothetical protein